MGDDACDLLCLDLERAEKLRQERLHESVVGPAAGIAKALSDPNRLILANALASDGELCVCDLAWVAERSDALVSHHLRVLREASLVTSRRDGKMVLYSLTAAGSSILKSILHASAVTH
jgi:DNA-binding transcriptional ArsR family regulator